MVSSEVPAWVGLTELSGEAKESEFFVKLGEVTAWLVCRRADFWDGFAVWSSRETGASRMEFLDERAPQSIQPRIRVPRVA
jgi:hypothetical protein